MAVVTASASELKKDQTTEKQQIISHYNLVTRLS